MRWHFLSTPPSEGALNMALDVALMDRARLTGDAVLRVYGWRRPVLSLGRNQRARGSYDRHAATAAGITFVRRPTGGRALLHDHEVTYSVTMPCPDTASATAAYHFINEVLLGALRGLGVRASMSSGGLPVPPGPRPCFDMPSAHEIVVGERKLVGSAQWRHDGVLLQHGSILVRDDQHVIATLMQTRQPELASTPSAATLFEALGREPEPQEVARHLLDALRGRLAGDVRCLELEAEVKENAARLRDTYSDDAWTWRR